jgi:hypothetical protein
LIEVEQAELAGIGTGHPIQNRSRPLGRSGERIEKGEQRVTNDQRRSRILKAQYSTDIELNGSADYAREISELKKDFRERLERHKNRQELLKWQAKHDVMMIEASLEYRTGVLIRQTFVFHHDKNPASMCIFSKDLIGEQKQRFDLEMSQMERDSEVLQQLLRLREVASVGEYVSV